MRELESLLLGALRTSPDAVVLADEHGRAWWVNPAAEVLFADDAAALRGRDLSGLLEAGRDLAGEPRAARLETHAGRELAAIRKDGTRVPCQVWVSEVPLAPGRVLCAFARDLRLSKRLEESLQEAQRMEALGILATGVAHDFNNLLTGISGCASLALDALERDHPARARLEEIRQSVRTGAQTVRKLIDYSRPGQEGAGVPRPIDLNDVVQHCQGLIEPMLGAGIDLILDLASDDTRAVAEPGLVEQVLYNLVSNARDAMPEGGQLTISTRRSPRDSARRESSTSRGYVGLAVTDTGTGMDAAVRQHLFEPFFTTKPRHKGSGLGLFSCQGLIQRWGGRIEVESQPGRGTRFEVVLHRASADEPDPAPSDRLPVIPPASGGTVLLVEDDRLVRLTTRYYLEQAGYEVLEARRGDDAVALARSGRRLDLLLTDVTLPGRSGRWVAQLTQAAHAGCRVLYMSAYPKDVLLEEGRIPVEASLLLKPFTREELLARVGAALERRA